MKISEVLLRVSENGDLCIPSELLQEMGLSPCDPVYLAYLTKDGEKNSYQEFLLSPNSIENKEDEQKILIPTPLLEQANLLPGEDIQILCLDRAILLYEALELERKDLEAILQQLQLASELGYLLPGEASSAILQLMLQIDMSEAKTLSAEILAQHQQLLSWAELFDSASIDEKKLISSQMIKAVTLTRNYGIQIEFNISEAQFLNGMEMG